MVVVVVVVVVVGVVVVVVVVVVKCSSNSSNSIFITQIDPEVTHPSVLVRYPTSCYVCS